MSHDLDSLEPLQTWKFDRVLGNTGTPLVVRAESELQLTVDGRRHRHADFYALYIVRGGRGVHVIDGVSYGISRGDVYLMRPGMEHQYRHYRELKIDAVYFTAIALTDRLRCALEELGSLSLLYVDSVPASGEVRLLHLSPSHYEAVYRLLVELRKEWKSQTASGAILAEGYFAHLLIRLLRLRAISGDALSSENYGGVASATSREEAIAAAVRYMDRHYPEEINVEDLAARAAFSARGFTRAFTVVMGRSPRNYLTYIRLERAKSLLAETSTPVTEVGDLAGFGAPAYFTRVFKAHTGQTPTEYRRRHGI